MNNYSGDNKRKILEKKKNNGEFKLIVTDWINGILEKTETFFEDFGEAQTFSEKQKGQIKIYDFHNQLIFSSFNERPKPPKPMFDDNVGHINHGGNDNDHHDNHHHGHHGHHGHYDEDDSYA